MDFFKGIRKNVLVLSLVSLLNDISAEMIFSVLPLFYSNVLMLDKAFIGIIEGLSDSASSIVRLFAGHFSDKWGKRKPFVFFGYLVSNLSRVVLAFARTGTQALGIRIVDRLGKGIRDPPRDALLAESSSEKERGKIFGFHRSMDTVGAVIGPLVAFAFFAVFTSSEASFRNLFVIAGIPGLVAALLVWFAVKESKKHKKQAGKNLRLDLKKFDAHTKRFLVISGIFALANYSYAFLLLRAGDLGMEIALIPLMYLLYNVVYAVMATPIGIKADAFGRKKMIVFGYGVFALTSIGFALATKSWHAILLFALYGLFSAINEPVPKAYVSTLTSAKLRATAIGAYDALRGLALLPASLLAGVLWESFGASSAFYVAAGIAAFAAVLLHFLESRE